MATRPGGIRSGDMSNNLQYKGTAYDATTQLYNNNVTQTSNTYYLPTVSDNSGTDNDIIINNYLGNNGRLEIANEMLHVTKLLQPPAGYTLTEDQEDETFNFQVYVQGVTGKRTAVRTEYNESSGTWERELAYIDVLTDNSDLVQTNDSTRAVFVWEDEVAKQVVQDGGDWYYAKEDGTLPTDASGAADASQKVSDPEPLYYMYLPANSSGTDTQHVRRLYQSEDYTGADADDFKDGLLNNGMDTAADGTTYSATDAELIPADEVKAAESISLEGDPGAGDGPSSIALESSGGGWTHGDVCSTGNHVELASYTFFTRKPSAGTSATNFASPYKTRTQYLTVELNFGYNANADDGSADTTSKLTQADLYDTEPLNGMDAEDIAKNTAEFTLRHGEGLLLTGLDENTDYRFTEKLTAKQVAKGYTLRQIEQIQQNSHPTYTGVDSVSGDTGYNEEQVNYINTFEPGTISITKELVPAEGATITDEDRATEFSFTLALVTAGGVGEPDGVYSYTVTDKDGKELKTGRLLPWSDSEDVPKELDPAYDAGKDILRNADGNTSWPFKLKAGETMTVHGLPKDSEFTYTVTETTPDDGYEVTDSDSRPESNNTDKTVTGTVGPDKAELVEMTFTNTKKKPEPAEQGLSLTKNVTGSEYTGKLEGSEFSFQVTPDPGNPADDPIHDRPGWDGSTLTVQNGPAGTDNKSTAQAEIFPVNTEFTQVGTYRYTVREVIPSETRPGISYSTAVYNVTITVKEQYIDGVYTGKLEAELTVNGEDTAIVFENPYSTTEVSVVLRAFKQVEVAGAVPQRLLPVREGDYTFTLTGISQEPLPGGDAPIAGPSMDESLPQNGPDLEEPPQSDGPVPDDGPAPAPDPAPDREATPTPTLTPTPDPQATAAPESSDTPVPSIAPELTPTPEPTLVPESTQEPLHGKTAPPAQGETGAPVATQAAPPAGDAPAEDNAPTGTPPQDGGPVDGDTTAPIAPLVLEGDTPPLPTVHTATTGADGYAYFEAIKYTEEGIYTYQIAEAAGNRPGVDYDTKVYNVTVTVTRVDGALQAKVEYEAARDTPPGHAMAEFVNTQHVGGLTVRKTVTGSGDKTREFRFTVTLTYDDGTPLEYLTGRYGTMQFTNGVATFTLRDGESLTAADLPVGAHYTVTETDYAGEGYTTTYKGEVGTITGDADAETEVTNYLPTPTPTPTPSATPGPTPESTPTPTSSPPPGRYIPQTGDDSPVLLWTVTLLGSFVGLLAIGCARWKKNKRERR